MTQEQIASKIKTKREDIDKMAIAQALIEVGWILDGLKKITIDKVVGTALSTATGAGLHSAIFDTRPAEIKLNIYREGMGRYVISVPL